MPILINSFVPYFSKLIYEMKKNFIKILSFLLPKLVVSMAYKQLTNPQIKKLRSHEMLVLDKATKETLPFKGFDIQLYTWQGGENKVLLVHGWEGQAGNFADLIEKLIQKNYTIYAFDAPSHGFSSKGKTSLFEFIDLVDLLIKKYQVTKLVSHSFGGVATTYALSVSQEVLIEKYLLFTVPDKFSERIDDVTDAVGITERVKRKLVQKFEDETNMSVNAMNVSDFVKNVNVRHALIIQDVKDRIIPIARAKNVQRNWKNSALLEIQGTGHFSILRNDDVLNKSIEFLS